MFDKGKPGENQGRKAMGLSLAQCAVYDCQAAENRVMHITIFDSVYKLDLADTRSVSFTPPIRFQPRSTKAKPVKTGDAKPWV